MMSFFSTCSPYTSFLAPLGSPSCPSNRGWCIWGWWAQTWRHRTGGGVQGWPSWSPLGSSMALGLNNRIFHRHGNLNINLFDQEFINHISNLVAGPTSKRLNNRIFHRHGNLNINMFDQEWINHISYLVAGPTRKRLIIRILHRHGDLNINTFDQEFINHISNLVAGPTSKRLIIRILHRQGDLNIDMFE